MASKFDRYTPTGPADLVRRVQELTKQVRVNRSTAQNAAALARRAVPLVDQIRSETNDTFTDGTTWTLQDSSINDLPAGTDYAAVMLYVSAGTTFTTSGGGGLGCYGAIDFPEHPDFNDGDPYVITPQISSGRGSPGPISVNSYGSNGLYNLVSYGATKIRLMVFSYRSGAAAADSDNAHLSATLMAYRTTTPH